MEKTISNAFLNGKQITITERMQPNSICYAGIPYEMTIERRKGTKDAADSIRKESLNYVECLDYMISNETYDCMWNEKIKYDGVRIYDAGNIPCDTKESMLQNVEYYVDHILQNQCFPLIVGGEHTITIPSFNAFNRLYKNVAYVHLDSHFDFGNEYSNGERIYRGSVSRRISEMFGNDLSRMFWIGCSDYTKNAQLEQIKNAGGNVFTICDIKTHGIEAIVDQLIHLLNQYDNIYLSFDVDVIDPAYMRATSGIPIMGLNPFEVMYIIRNLLSLNVRVWDIVEHSPILDITNSSTFLLSQMITKLLVYFSQSFIS